jgi:hypothetical protein
MSVLTIRQTVMMWGGFGRGFPVTRAVRAMDVTAVIREVRPSWGPANRIATVHIGVETFFWPRSKTGEVALRRQIVDARRVLREQGFTHIAVTGPFLIDVRSRTRLEEATAFRNARAVAKPVEWIYQARLWSACRLNPRRYQTHSERLSQLKAFAGPGFATYAVFCL